MSTLFRQPPDILKGKASSTPADILGGKFSNAPPDLLRNTSGPVMSVFGRTGYVIAQAGDYTADLVTNAVDQTGRYANPVWITSLDYSKILNAPAVPSIAAYQSPWLQNIDAAGHQLINASNVGIGTATPLNPLHVVGNPNWVDLPPQPGYGWAYFANNDGSAGLSFGGNSTWGSGAGASWIQASISNGTQMGTLVLQPARGYVGINQVMPAHQLDVQGDVNTSGRYLQNGSPLPGQSPWLQDVDAANHNLTNLSYLHLKSPTVNVADIYSTGIVDGTSPGMLLVYASAAATPASYEAMGGLWLNFTGAHKSAFGLYSNGIPCAFWALASDIQFRAGNTGANAMVVAASGYVGIGNSAPAHALDVVGDCNITGQYLQNGVPISSGGSQSPWIGDVDAAGHDLNNVDLITSTHGLVMTAPYGFSAGGGSVTFQNGSSRMWQLTPWGAATGSNTGNDLILSAFDDAGAYLSTPLNISRSTGKVTLGNALSVGGDIDAGGHNLSNANNISSKQAYLYGDSSTPAIQGFYYAGAARWLVLSAGAEGGSNTGSDFEIARFNDAGALQDISLTITRATGKATFGSALTAAGMIESTSGGYKFPDGTTQITAATGGPGGAQSPWTGNVDAAGFSLNNVDTVTSNGAGLVFTKPWQVGNTAGGSIEWHNGAIRRWAMTNWNAETGSNVGSDFILSAFDDSGALLYTPLTITRSTGAVKFIGVLDLQNHDLNNVAYMRSHVNQLSGVSGDPPAQYFMVGAKTRWAMLTRTNESTGNVGSDLAVYSFNDAGSFLGMPVQITRSTGNVTLSGSLAVNSGAAPTAALDVIGAAKVQQTLTIYDPTSNGTALLVTSLAGNNSSVALQTGGSTRWLIAKTGGAEGGSNTGSDFNLQRYSDAGASIGTPLSILRSSGYIGLGTNGPSRPVHIYNAAAAAPSLSATAEIVAVDTSNQILLGIGASSVSPFPLWLQGKNRTNNGSSYPIVLNPLGGNIGIGNVNPAFPLDVSGDINTTGVFRVNGTPLSTSGAMTFRGAWNGGTLYAQNDVVLYGGVEYIRLIASNPSTSPAVVQSKGVTAAASLAFTTPVTKGNLIVLACSSSHGIPSAPADNLGTVYTEGASYTGGLGYSKLYYGVAPATGACTPTFTSGGGHVAIRIFELQNCNPVVNVGGSISQGSSNPTALTLTTTVANTFAIVSIYEYYSAGTAVTYAATAGQGTTFLFTTTSDGAAAASSKSIPTASANPLGFTVTAGSGYDYQCIVAAAFTTGAQTPDIDPINWQRLSAGQTPWTANENAAGYVLSNLGAATITNPATTQATLFSVLQPSLANDTLGSLCAIGTVFGGGTLGYIAFKRLSASSRAVLTHGHYGVDNILNIYDNAMVGINKTTAAAYALDVVGDINCTGSLRVNGTPLTVNRGVSSQANPRRLANTVYQNTGDQAMMVSVSIALSDDRYSQAAAYVDADSEPATVVQQIAGGPQTHPLVFWVLPSYYYQVETDGEVMAWTEWTS